MGDLFELAVEELKVQRHDFMNYIQVILGYIQINRPNDAVEYIIKINSRTQVISKIFNLESKEFGVLLHHIIYALYRLDIDVVFDSEIDYIDHMIFSKNIDKLKLYFDMIKIRLEKLLSENFSDVVFINVTGTTEIFTLNIFNNNVMNCDNENAGVILNESIESSDGCSLELLSMEKDFCFKLAVFK